MTESSPCCMIIISLLLIHRNRCTQASTSSDSAGFLAFLSEQLKDAVQCSMRCQSKFCQLLQHCRKNLFSKYLQMKNGGHIPYTIPYIVETCPFQRITGEPCRNGCGDRDAVCYKYGLVGSMRSFNLRPKVGICQLNLPHETKN